jgi:HEAT repeat protein
MEESAVIDAAKRALETTKPSTARIEAAALLCELAANSQHWPALQALLPGLLEDAQPEVRRVGVSLAGLLLDPETAKGIFEPKTSDVAEDVRLEATGQLADQRKPENRAALASRLEDGSFRVRFESARGLAALHHPAGLEVLCQALKDDALRFRALGALAELGDERGLPAVRAIFQRWFLSGFDRTHAAGTLAKLGDPQGLEYLIKRVGKRRGMDRGLAIELLGELKAEGAYALLEGILKSPKDGFRGAAARGLGRLGDPRGVEVLLEVLDEAGAPDELRLDVAEGLCRLKEPRGLSRVAAVANELESEEARQELLAMLEER